MNPLLCIALAPLVLGCTSVRTLTREEVTALAAQPETARSISRDGHEENFDRDAPLRLHTEQGDVGPKPLRTLRADGERVRLDDIQLWPRDIDFGELTVAEKGKTAGLIAGVAVGAGSGALLTAFLVAVATIHPR
jgi:hypothetical protein